MSDDVFRVIYTRPDGFVIPGLPKTRDEAMEYFDGVLGAGPLPVGARMRVLSDFAWRNSPNRGQFRPAPKEGERNG